MLSSSTVFVYFHSSAINIPWTRHKYCFLNYKTPFPFFAQSCLQLKQSNNNLPRQQLVVPACHWVIVSSWYNKCAQVTKRTYCSLGPGASPLLSTLKSFKTIYCSIKTTLGNHWRNSQISFYPFCSEECHHFVHHTQVKMTFHLFIAVLWNLSLLVTNVMATRLYGKLSFDTSADAHLECNLSSCMDVRVFLWILWFLKLLGCF